MSNMKIEIDLDFTVTKQINDLVAEAIKSQRVSASIEELVRKQMARMEMMIADQVREKLEELVVEACDDVAISISN